MKYLRNILYALLTLITLIFIIQNFEDFSRTLQIRLDLFVFSFETMPIAGWVLFLLSFLAGVMLASIGGLLEMTRIKGELKAFRKENAQLREELSSLRNLPITEEPVSTPPAVVEEEQRLEDEEKSKETQL